MTVSSHTRASSSVNDSEKQVCCLNGLPGSEDGLAILGGIIPGFDEGEGGGGVVGLGKPAAADEVVHENAAVTDARDYVR
ncbi:hypothetical protein Pelo_17744 [Pelomyxa schiedti]|nr:hypothetical protein Pelo_17744 [Pelomyxa schiedti]